MIATIREWHDDHHLRARHCYGEQHDPHHPGRRESLQRQSDHGGERRLRHHSDHQQRPNLGGGAKTITTSGLSLNSLNISGIIQNGSLIKTGAGSLSSLSSNNSTFAGGVALNQGLLIVGSSDLLNFGVVAAVRSASAP